MPIGPRPDGKDAAQSTTASLAAKFGSDLARLGFNSQRAVLGLAVSGGSDSRALLQLAHAAGLKARVATVDHGLREAAAQEAAQVALVARELGFAHDTLRWQGWDGRGNLQDQARRARRRLLAQWARQHGLSAVAMAHTRDDLAETFLMRLARGAGVDGLSAMQDRFCLDGVAFLRPLLWATRAALRAYLLAIGADWIDDPSNLADRFDRVRIRNALPELARLGLTTQVLADVGHHMAQARAALDHATDLLARASVAETAGILTVSPDWKAAPSDLQRRLLLRLLGWLAPTDYAPRGPAVTAALGRLLQGQGTQLAGCHFLPHGAQILAFREARACPAAVPAAQIWDGLWQWQGEIPAGGAEVRALGADGLAQWTGWRAIGLPRPALLSQPSLWRQNQLLATPLQADLRVPLQGVAPHPSAFHRLPTANSLFSMRLSD